MGSSPTAGKNRAGRAAYTGDTSGDPSTSKADGVTSSDGSIAGIYADSRADSAQVGVGPPPGAPVAGMEPLGLVGGSDDLIAQAEQVASEIPAIDPATGQAPAPNINGQWSALTPPAVEVLSAVVFPAWEIQTSEQRPVSEALAECLDQVFPGGIEGRYACWVRLIFAGGAICVSRIAVHGRLPPLFVPKRIVRSASSTNGAAAPPASITDPLTASSLTQ